MEFDPKHLPQPPHEFMGSMGPLDMGHSYKTLNYIQLSELMYWVDELIVRTVLPAPNHGIDVVVIPKYDHLYENVCLAAISYFPDWDVWSDIDDTMMVIRKYPKTITISKTKNKWVLAEQQRTNNMMIADNIVHLTIIR